ncbi:MAG: type II secretion system F family protein [Patescibacteria group bacterium]
MVVSRIALSGSEKIGLLSNLSTLLTAGIPILDAVSTISEDSKGREKILLESLRADLQQGKPVHISLSAFPHSFDRVTINLLRAAEGAGTLEVTLRDLRDHLQKEIEFTDKIRFALIYPLLIGVVFFGVMLAILIFVVPRISSVFSRLNIPLPWPTKIMVFMSDLVVKQTWYLLGGITVVSAVMFFFYKNNRQLVLEIVSSLPVISKLVREVDLVRFFRSMSLLLSSGLPITTALELTQDVVFKKRTAKAIKASLRMVTSGKKLSEGFIADKPDFPITVIRLIEAGEKSGTLDKAMGYISGYLDYQVSNSLKAFTSLIEPVMLLLVGLCVGGMMMAIIAPIYGLIGQVGGR